MKTLLTKIVLLLVAIGSLQAVGYAKTVKAVPLYRLYGQSHHFYTTNKAERDSAIQNANYVDEGVAGWVMPEKVPGTVALWRYVKEIPNYGTRHFYASNSVSRNAAVNDGYKSEGICCWVSEKGEDSTLPFLHLYLAPKPLSQAKSNAINAGGDDHLYTTNTKEKFDAINKWGYVVQTQMGFIWTAYVYKNIP